MPRAVSSTLDRADRFLSGAGFDRAPWVAVALGGGIAAWFALDRPAEWLGAVALLLGGGAAAGLMWRGVAVRVHLRQALVAMAIAAALGIALIWARSAMVGAEPLPYPRFTQIEGRVIERIEQPAEQRTRLVLAARDGESGDAIKLRINVPEAADRAQFSEGARVRLRARLMPPASPMLPGAYDFARTAWFEGYAATGSAVGEVELVEPGIRGDAIVGAQRRISGHVREQLGGSAGAIAAAFASGDRGAIEEADAEAMRNAGLTHLLSISGLHVSAVIAATYLLVLKLLALWPWLALRVRLPLVAAAGGALAGIAYTLLTGGQVPTVRACVAALLVLVALALGREALSLRMVAVAACFVMLLWPEAVMGPSFQMSFAAVIAIVALHGSVPVRAFLAPRAEGWWTRAGRNMLMLLATGMVIELTLMPIVLFHFHRAGLYGALANVIAIPLVTFIAMPLIAIALALDLVGLGAPVWWLVGQSLDLLLAIAHTTASQPGAVKLSPAMDGLTFVLFLAGLLWLGLWSGKVRRWAAVPLALATIMLLRTPVPDILITGDGRHVALAGEGERLVVLRDTRSDYTRDNLRELAATEGETLAMDRHPGAQCSRDFCVVTVTREGREWQLLLARSHDQVGERALAAACERVDIVVADRSLPRSCRPRWLKADRRYLRESGGLAITLADHRIRSVADGQGAHGWWAPLARDGERRDRQRRDPERPDHSPRRSTPSAITNASAPHSLASAQ